jgi:hypothetical protein
MGMVFYETRGTIGTRGFVWLYPLLLTSRQRHTRQLTCGVRSRGDADGGLVTLVLVTYLMRTVRGGGDGDAAGMRRR